jgi:hypothetical protein
LPFGADGAYFEPGTFRQFAARAVISAIGVGYEASAFYGSGAPKSTAAPINDKLDLAIEATLMDQ